MIQLEIEIVSAAARSDVFELRNFLQEKMEAWQLSIKEQPAQEGQMGLFTAETIINGVIHAGLGISIERSAEVLLALVKDWLHSRKLPLGDKIEVVSTVNDGNSQLILSEDSEGTSKRYDNVAYSIDATHTRAVLIGTSEFDYDFPGIPPVQGNLEDLGRLLADKRHIGLPPENISVALNKSNTEIEELLLRIGKLPDTKTLLIYYAGHGYRSDVKKLYLIARNTKKIDDFILGGIDYDFIKNVIVRNSPARQKIIILDACYSGIATQGTDDPIINTEVTGTYTLSSSDKDEVSYYEKNQRNTFFTGVLVDTLRKGIDNSNDMLSLNDLYENARSQLDQKQQPRFRDKLDPVSPDNFFIARNPAFSLEKVLENAQRLYAAGHVAEAAEEFKRIDQRHPGFGNVSEWLNRCNEDMRFIQFAREGDDFSRNGNYKSALEKYKRAYQIKQELSVSEKIKECENNLRGNGTPSLPDTDKGKKKQEENPVPPRIKNEDPFFKSLLQSKKKEGEDKEKKHLVKNLVGLGLAIAVVAAGWFIISRTHPNKEEKITAQQWIDSLSASPQTALTALEPLSDTDDSASYVLGKYYYSLRDFGGALRYWLKAKTISAAYLGVAQMYYDDDLPDDDDNTKALSYATQSVRIGPDTTAYGIIGDICWDNGSYNKKANQDSFLFQANEWYKKGEAMGSHSCVLKRSNLLYSELGDYDLAFPVVKKAAELGYPDAQNRLGSMLHNGQGTPINRTAAADWFRKAITRGNPSSMVNLATMFLAGHINGSINCDSAVTFLRRAEDLGFSNGLFYADMGDVYENGCVTSSVFSLNLEPDHEKAKQYYIKGAKLKNQHCIDQCVRLGISY